MYQKEGYFEASITPGFWRHKWRPIQFILIGDDFGVNNMGKKHAEHLASVLKITMKYQRIGKAKTFQALTKYGTMHRGIVAELADC